MEDTLKKTVPQKRIFNKSTETDIMGLYWRKRQKIS